jgi:formylglycine-generating enzyme required for sulfatase activity
MPAERRLEPLSALGQSLADARDGGDELPAGAVSDTAEAMVALIASGVGTGRQRLALGEALGRLGDPRLRLPHDPDYWVEVDQDGHRLRIGRYPVTNLEFRGFVASGGYAWDGWWTEEGRAWRDSGVARWPELSVDTRKAAFMVPNQPVVLITWYEAAAYAASHGARLPEFDERLQVMRGGARRPYPWGEPFGDGNANTREEVLGRPCAVGLFRADVTPDGVWDLAGNVAEWTSDDVGERRVVHPGSWAQPSMAAWAKAIALRPPTFQADDLGFRLAVDVG